MRLRANPTFNMSSQVCVVKIFFFFTRCRSKSKLYGNFNSPRPVLIAQKTNLK